MMYEFCDTIGTPSNALLPSEAICYDGVWIDNDISLYRTLYTSGRESFNADVAELSLESMDGSAFLRKRLRPRTITVGYQITAANAHEMMTAYNRLNKLMRGTQVQVIFADEPDKYYIGTCVTIGTPEPGRLTVKSEMEIYCPDPCKHALEEKTVSPTSGRFAVEYAGTYPARPTFTADFSGNTQKVMFTGDDAVVVAGGTDANTFQSGDSLTIDCSAAEIYLNSEKAPSLGDIANEYESMLLQPGANIITASSTGSSPTLRMKYREAWL